MEGGSTRNDVGWKNGTSQSLHNPIRSSVCSPGVRGNSFPGGSSADRPINGNGSSSSSNNNNRNSNGYRGNRNGCSGSNKNHYYPGGKPFHHSDTLPPNAVEERASPNTFSAYDEDEYCLHRTGSCSLQQNDTNGQDSMVLRLRIEGVRNLVPASRISQNPPSTFVVVQAACGRGRTPVIYNNTNLSFNDEFVLQISNTETEEITITLVAVTTLGNRKLGQCVLSVMNLVRGELRRRWVTLVRHPGTDRAYEYADMLVLLYTESFGAHSVPPVAKENEFRERLRALLRTNDPKELHRLEWYVAKFKDNYDDAFASLDAKYRTKCEPAAFQLTIKFVSDLVEKNAKPTARETCYVRIVAGHVKKITKMVPYQRLARFNETFDLNVEYPRISTVSVAVYSANHKFGECLISLNGLQRGVPKERKHPIVYAAGTGDACYCGNITVVLHTTEFGSDEATNDENDEVRRIRVRNYLWKYLRDELHRLDPIVTSAGDIDALMMNWKQEYGPEPPLHSVQLCIQSLRSAVRGRVPVSYAVIVRVGPAMHRSPSVRSREDWVINHAMNIPICSPEKDEILFIVVQESDINDVEIGRTTMSFKNIHWDKLVQRELQIYQNALTCEAKPFASLSIECIVKSCGLWRETADVENVQYFRRRAEALLSRYDPSQLHRIEYLLGDFAGRGEELIKYLTDLYGPETGSAPMRIRVLGIRDLVPFCSCYVKVYLDNVPVLRTNDHYAAKLMRFDISMKNEVSVLLENPVHSVLKFKVAEHRRLRNSRVLGFAEMSLRNLVRQEPNVCWLPLFDVTANEEIGELGVELQSAGFAKGTVTIYDPPRTGSGRTVLEEVTRDVTSLIRKYRPQDILHAQPLVAQATSLKEAHQEIRAKLASESVALTFYVQVDKIEISQRDENDALEKGLISLTASCMGEKERSCMKVTWADKIDTRRFYPEMRLDIPFPRDFDPTQSVPSLEILLHEVPSTSGQHHSASARRSMHGSMMRFLTQGRELGRAVLSIRALLTAEVYHLGEPLEVYIIRSSTRSTTARASHSKLRADCFTIVGKITLRILTPLFERIPQWIRFNSKAVQHFHPAYVRYYEKRIAHFYRSYDPWKLQDFHFIFYEREVASAKWPVSLHNWLLALIKRYGPEPRNNFGPPPKFPIDPDGEEEGGMMKSGGWVENGRRDDVVPPEREGTRYPSTMPSRSRSHSRRHHADAHYSQEQKL